jgi:ABC-2 type transport system permease protein
MRIKENFIAYKTIVIKEMVRVLRIWTQTIVPPAITMTLYFIIFGKMIGSQLQPIDGLTYMQFIAPGLIMMPVISAAYINTAGTFFMAKFQKSIEEVLVSPTPNYIVILGFISGGIFRALLISVIVSIISLFFTHLRIHYYFITFAIIFLAATLFSLAGMLNAIFANKFDDISFVPNFVLTPLTYLGGVFYSIKLLPSFWQHVSLFNPILHIVDAFRFGILGICDVNVGFALGITAAFIVALFAINLILLNKGVGIRA